ncbi:hypothetical protein CKO51_21220 [Rhodopirellula sp. SM50]|nr:hypothetical protein CKO51_21220 [Rhodopirellula sp. SM50]
MHLDSFNKFVPNRCVAATSATRITSIVQLGWYEFSQSIILQKTRCGKRMLQSTLTFRSQVSFSLTATTLGGLLCPIVI